MDQQRLLTDVFEIFIEYMRCTCLNKAPREYLGEQRLEVVSEVVSKSGVLYVTVLLITLTTHACFAARRI